MLSYRHVFHAGNHADVLKHIVLQQQLEHLNRKPAPWFALDTHAGAGIYDLDSPQGRQTGEAVAGVGRLEKGRQHHPAIEAYLELVARSREGSTASLYPGSPALLRHYQRESDRLALCELHASDYALLQEFLRPSRNVSVLQEDGFDSLRRFLPPAEKRGLVFCDPSYELAEDYERVIAMLAEANRRFPTGSALLWYPVVERSRIDLMEQKLRRSGLPDLHLFELSVSADTPGFGMTGSGVIAMRPAWTVPGLMREVLPALVKLLERSPGSGAQRCLRLTPE